MERSVRILAAADIHLGRRIPPLPEGAPPCSLTSALKDLIDCAVDKKVDAVTISGDLIDQEIGFFEAFLPLKEASLRLEKAGIPLVLVAGNHDAKVLPRIVETLKSKNTYLLGEGQKWESLQLVFKGRPFRFYGWSPLGTHFPESPFKGSYFPEKEGRETLIGLLHTDALCGKKSLYAPTTLLEFEKTPIDCWVLGHIHENKELSAKVFYPGSLQGLDVSEQGSKGACLLTFREGKPFSKEHIPIGKLRWEKLFLDVTDAETLEECLLEKLSLFKGQNAEVVGFRVYLTGRREKPFDLFEKSAVLVQTALNRSEAGALLFVESIENKVLPLIDLKALAEGDDPLSKLYQINLKKEEFFREFKERIKDSPYFPESFLEEGDIEAIFEDAGLFLMSKMVEQR